MSSSWVPPEIDTATPSSARVYDVHLGGAHNFAADRELARDATRVMPELPSLLQANRSFLRRGVEFLVAAGMRQFLDLGSGIPTVGNVHEIAHRTAPSSRVVYVDNDPVATAHSRLLLGDVPGATAVQADLRDPDQVWTEATRTDGLDPRFPIAVLAIAVLHFVPDTDNPARILGRYTAPLTPGSYLAVSHATAGEDHPERVREAAGLYAQRIPGFTLRSREQIAGFFGDLDLVDPGLVYLELWRPDHDPQASAPGAELLPAYAGVATMR